MRHLHGCCRTEKLAWLFSLNLFPSSIYGTTRYVSDKNKKQNEKNKIEQVVAVMRQFQNFDI